MTNAEKVQAAKEHGKKLGHHGARGGRVYDARGNYLCRGWADYYDYFIAHRDAKKTARKPKKAWMVRSVEIEPLEAKQAIQEEIKKIDTYLNDQQMRDLLSEIATWYCDLLFSNEAKDQDVIKGLLASDLHPLMVRARNLVLGRN